MDQQNNNSNNDNCNGDIIELQDTLYSFLSQLRILQTSPFNITKSTNIEPGKLVSFSIFPYLSQNAGHIADASLNLTGISPLNGTIPVVQGIPISINVEWLFKDEQNNQLVEGQDFLALDGMNCLRGSFIFKPTCFIEHTNSPTMSSNNLPTHYTLHASVTLMAGDTFVTEELPPVSLSILPMSVPTIFTVFRNEHFARISADSHEFKGKALVMVPPNSPFRSKEDLYKSIEDLIEKASALSAFNNFSLFGLGLEILYNALNSQYDIHIRIETRINLNHVTLDIEPLEKKSWGNKIESFIFIGPPNRSVLCQNNSRNNQEDTGKFTVTIDSLNKNCYVLSRKLDSKKPETEPLNTELIVTRAPKDTFANNIEVIEFEETNAPSICL
ncbi:hypothetical protein E8M24_28210 [Bacillus thuringiensis]|uniref:hypothetical protein n=1 Tax=Bacillus thuringiensis TaxID=1428 RepID=UPI00125F5718|nr:hypothetical protein [Bacillus thuringiensis]KAB5632415.1 hypothetical protein E8M24_28210 [Bacillus thuringiensis]HDR5270591.1 hypothetical protein [Bacillus thuringiensis]